MQPTEYLLDQHIREALKKTLREQDSTAAIFDELPLMRGRGRADLAFVNGKLCGYEIKSQADSLVRLGMQTANYESIFEFNTLVAVEKHLRVARQRLPKTWGIIEVKHVGGRIEFHALRQAKQNRNMSTSALARLLWKNECRAILRKAGIVSHSDTPVVELWTLIESLAPQYLCNAVKEALKRRQVKSAVQQILYGD